MYTLQYVSSNPLVATATNAGVLTGVGAGSAQINVTATLLDTGGTASATVNVTVGAGGSDGGSGCSSGGSTSSSSGSSSGGSSSGSGGSLPPPPAHASPALFDYAETSQGLSPWMHSGALVVSGWAGVENSAQYQSVRAAGGLVLAYVDLIHFAANDTMALREHFTPNGTPTLSASDGADPIVDVSSPTMQATAASALKWLMGLGIVDGVFLDELGPELWTPAWNQIDQARFSAGVAALTNALADARDAANPGFLLIANNVWDPSYASTVSRLNGICLEDGPVDAYHIAQIAPSRFARGVSYSIVIDPPSSWESVAGVAWISNQTGGIYNQVPVPAPWGRF
jgi:hypothetical protein